MNNTQYNPLYYVNPSSAKVRPTDTNPFRERASADSGLPGGRFSQGLDLRKALSELYNPIRGSEEKLSTPEPSRPLRALEVSMAHCQALLEPRAPCENLRPVGHRRPNRLTAARTEDHRARS